MRYNWLMVNKMTTIACNATISNPFGFLFVCYNTDKDKELNEQLNNQKEVHSWHTD